VVVAGPNLGTSGPPNLGTSGGPTVEINPPSAPPSVTIVPPASQPTANRGGTDIANWAGGQQEPGSPWGTFGAPIGATSFGTQNPSGTLTTAIPTYWGPSSGVTGEWRGDPGGAFTPGAVASFGNLGPFGGLSSTGMGGTYLAQAIRQGMGKSFKKHADGGRIPGPASSTDNLLAMLATGEHVINADATAWADRVIGRNFLDDLNSRRIPVQMGYAEGGRVSGQPGGASVSSDARGRSPEVHIYNFTDRDKLRKALLESPEGQKVIVDTIEGSRIDLGFGF
nr:hypothetical protein [Verrucomicrobiota bacterium]